MTCVVLEGNCKYIYSDQSSLETQFQVKGPIK